MSSGGGGFEEIFEHIRGIVADLANNDAEHVLFNERLRILEERSAPAEVATQQGEAAELAWVPGAAVSWHNLTPQQRSVLWPQFVVWTLWLADRYEVTNDQIPRQCWWKHGALVEELTALWTSHQSAYAAEEDAGSAPYLWQDALSRAIERIGRLWLGSCRNGQHKERHRQPWIGEEPYLEEVLQAYGPPTEGPQQGATETPQTPPSEAGDNDRPEQG
ncbi:hypothetical protein [Streptacidiphilus melanogenes]|uniref:hypothetical protein n=1 Tax=Streptacidiphilus melanogenes TaxID=411235 RepID=UPI0006942466|nr:hypothetical protein [Streptacidiphilus melanogenes]